MCSEMISKPELINMLWGLAAHDQYWEKLNLDIINSGGKIVLNSEQHIARKIGMRFLYIRSELIESKTTIELNVPSVVLEGVVPDLISGTKIEEYLNFCIENAKVLSNSNT